jgi:hypothetical protein
MRTARGTTVERLKRFREKLDATAAAGTRLLCLEEIQHPGVDVYTSLQMDFGVRKEDWPLVTGGIEFKRVANWPDFKVFEMRWSGKPAGENSR